MTTMQAERRTAQMIEVRDLETTGNLSRLSGIAVPYGTMTDIGPFYESFERGAFGKSIRESARALPLMVEHGAGGRLPIGAAESWSDDVDGLRGVWRFTDSDHAQEAARAVRDGVLSFMSVRFMPNEARMRVESVRLRTLSGELLEKRHFTHVEARLLETSLVSAPAYAGATVEWVRSALAGDEPYVEMAPESKPTRRFLNEWRDELARLR